MMRVMATGHRVPSVLPSRRNCRVAPRRPPWGFQDPDPRSAAPVSLRPDPEDFLHRAPTFHAPQSAMPALDKLLLFPATCLKEGTDASFSSRRRQTLHILLSLENGRH